MTILDPQLAAYAAISVYRDELDTNYNGQLFAEGYTFLEEYDDPTTGFYAEVWRNDATGELIVALRGTDFSTTEDWYAKINGVRLD